MWNVAHELQLNFPGDLTDREKPGNRNRERSSLKHRICVCAVQFLGTSRHTDSSIITAHLFAFLNFYRCSSQSVQSTRTPPTPTPPPFTMKWQRWQPQIRLDLTTIPITYSRREKQQRCVGVESSNRYGGGYVYIQWSRGEGSRSRKVGRLIIFVEPHKVYGH